MPKDVSMPFYRELLALQARYDQMTSALDWKDPVKVRVTACNLALAWLQMEAAFIKFIRATPVKLGPRQARETGINRKQPPAEGAIPSCTE